MQARERLGEVGMKRGERFRLPLRGVEIGDCREAERAGEPLNRSLLVQRRGRRRLDRELTGRKHGRPHQQHAQEQQKPQSESE